MNWTRVFEMMLSKLQQQKFFLEVQNVSGRFHVVAFLYRDDTFDILFINHLHINLIYLFLDMSYILTFCQRTRKKKHLHEGKSNINRTFLFNAS